MVDSDGSIHAVDFGIMGRLDLQTRLYIAETLVCIFTKDYERAAQLHLDAGYIPQGTSIGAFSLALRSIGEPMLSLPPNEISVGRLLGHLFHVTKTFGMETQPHLLLLQKVVVAEGTTRSINPSLNLWEIAQPLLEDWIRLRTSPEQQAREASAALRRLIIYGPHLLTKFEKAVTSRPTKQDANESSNSTMDQRVRPFLWPATILIAILVVITVLG